MSETMTCAGCGGTMEEGFMLDRVNLSSTAGQRWREGEAEFSFWGNLNMGAKRTFKVMTYRCEQCGRLESYAREESVS